MKNKILVTIISIIIFITFALLYIYNKEHILKIIIIIIFSFTILFLYLKLYYIEINRINNNYNFSKEELERKYIKKIDDTKKDLELRGMTFSGEAVIKLGKESAYSDISDDGEILKEKFFYLQKLEKDYNIDLKKATYTALLNIFKK